MRTRLGSRILTAACWATFISSPALAQTKEKPAPRPTATKIQPGGSHVFRVQTKGGRFPSLTAEGDLKAPYQTSCAKAASSDFSLGGGSGSSGSLSLMKGDIFDSKKLVSNEMTMGMEKFCATHEITIQNEGPGVLAVK